MDDIMILLHQIFIDLHGFNESHFGIFDDDDVREELLTTWRDRCNRDSTAFVKLLSPAQQRVMAIWACDRTSYSTDELIDALDKFVEFLRDARNVRKDATRYPMQFSHRHDDESSFRQRDDTTTALLQAPMEQSVTTAQTHPNLSSPDNDYVDIYPKLYSSDESRVAASAATNKKRKLFPRKA